MKTNASLTGVLPKIFNRDNVDQRRLGELVDLISDARFTGHGEKKARDVLGEVYEYFLEMFARAEGKRGGEFYTPASVVKVLVEVLEPYSGRVYDPCCGSGGMFVQAEKFVLAHQGRRDDLAVYGQESNERTWRLAKMNLAIHGISGDLSSRWEDTFYADKHPDKKADFILANPPFNMSDWARKTDDPQMALRRSPGGQRELRLAPAHRLQAQLQWLGRRGPGQRLDVLEAVRRRRDPQGAHRDGPGRLHDRAAPATLPHHPDPRLPVVFLEQQGPPSRQAPERPPRRHPLHRRAEHGHDAGSHRARPDGRRRRQDRWHLPRLARHRLRPRGRPEVRRHPRLLLLGSPRRGPQARPHPHPRPLRGRRRKPTTPTTSQSRKRSTASRRNSSLTSTSPLAWSRSSASNWSASMSEWKSRRLEEVVQLKRGFDLATRDRRPGPYPVVGSAGISGWHDEGPIPGPALVLGRAGASMGVASYCEVERFWPLNTALFVEDFKGNDPRFIFHLFQVTDLTGFNSGSVQPMLNRNYIRNVCVRIPGGG